MSEHNDLSIETLHMAVKAMMYALPKEAQELAGNIMHEEIEVLGGGVGR